MDVLTEEDLRVDVRAPASRLPLYAAVLAYAALVFTAVAHHEAWADEAQSWLLGRDASLVDLWTRLLHYEGTPGLWQTLLHALARTGLPYSAMNMLSGLFGLAAACILVWRAPFPLAIRVALPFTFYLCYQYAVIARSYDLLPLLLFCCAAIYPAKPWLFTVLLCLMSAVSVHGMALALALAVSVSVSRRRLPLPAIASFIAIVILLAAAARPAPDGTFLPGLNFSFAHLIDVSGKAFQAAFTGEWTTSLLVVALSVPLLWRGGGWLFFLLASTMLCGVAAVVYSQVWHHGVLFLAWLFAVWISWRAPGNPPDFNRLSHHLALASLAIVAAVQCYWTVCAITYDWGHAYSGSLAAASGIRQLDLQGRKLYAIGYASTAIQPYFSSNIFANVNDGRPEAYWDWSRRNHVNQDSLRLAELQPDYVIVGYKNQFERGVWTDLVRKGGYRAIRHFEGNSFWHTRVFEPESYDLYQRSSAP
jgi:hypothetical protein